MTAVDVVVVTYASRALIDQIVVDARALGLGGEVVVVDNGTDGSGDRAEELGARVVRRPDNPGFGAGQNEGLNATTAPYVLLLNPDARPCAAGIEEGRRHLDAHPEVAATQGAVVQAGSSHAERSQGRELGAVHLLGRALGARRFASAPRVRALARRTHLADYVDRGVREPTDVASLAATALLVRRTAMEAIGGFDEGYFLYGEDLDLCRRLRGAGWRLVALPVRFAEHVGGASSEGWWVREIEWWRGTMGFAARWWSSAAWVGALGAALVRVAGLVVRRPRNAAAVWRALIGEPRKLRRARARG